MKTNFAQARQLAPEAIGVSNEQAKPIGACKSSEAGSSNAKAT
jgi:hypothetical protein